MRCLWAFMLLLTVGDVHAAEPPRDAELRLLLSQGRGTAAGRLAWDKIVAEGPVMIPHLLEAMNQGDIVAANWLRTALDAIVQGAGAKGDIDGSSLLAFARSPGNQGRARRLALELAESLKPGISAALFAEPAMRDDAEFRFEAVAVTLTAARTALEKSDKSNARKLYRTAFESSRDVQQGRDAAAALQQLGESASVARHLGFLMDWYLIGPFDGMGQTGFHRAYPPEQKVDLAEELDGQGKKVRWKHYVVREADPASGAKHQALVNLREKDALGDADDAVAFAYTEFTVPEAGVAEFRGAADDNFTVWVNGAKSFAFEEYRNGVRLDRHRFNVPLKQGRNTVLVKICQSAAPNPEPNWEFFLRVVDGTGRGVVRENVVALPPGTKR